MALVYFKGRMSCNRLLWWLLSVGRRPPRLCLRPWADTVAGPRALPARAPPLTCGHCELTIAGKGPTANPGPALVVELHRVGPAGEARQHVHRACAVRAGLPERFPLCAPSPPPVAQVTSSHLTGGSSAWTCPRSTDGPDPRQALTTPSPDDGRGRRQALTTVTAAQPSTTSAERAPCTRSAACSCPWKKRRDEKAPCARLRRAPAPARGRREEMKGRRARDTPRLDCLTAARPTGVDPLDPSTGRTSKARATTGAG